MKVLLLILSFLCCAVAFPMKLIKREWPTIVDEPTDHPGDWFHRAKNMAVETVRENANFYTKLLSFTNAVQLTALIILAFF